MADNPVIDTLAVPVTDIVPKDIVADTPVHRRILIAVVPTLPKADVPNCPDTGTKSTWQFCNRDFGYGIKAKH